MEVSPVKKRKKKRKNTGRRFPVVWEMVFALLTLVFALTYADQVVSETEMENAIYIVPFAFWFMGAAHFFRSLILRPRGKLLFWYTLVCAGLYLAMGFLLIGLEFSAESLIAVNACYWGILAGARIVSVIRNHTWRSAILNLPVIFILLVFVLGAFEGIVPLYLVLLLVSMQALFFVMEVSFARIRIDVLRKIIKKTYAAEIIFGLLILIFAFSYVLMRLEDSMVSFQDALWYCFALVTTIGFGDMTAVTPLGRILSVILGVYGIIVVALITSVIVNFYGEMTKPEPPQEQEEQDRGEAD